MDDREGIWKGTRISAGFEARGIAGALDEVYLMMLPARSKKQLQLVHLLKEQVEHLYTMANRLSLAEVVIDAEPED